MPDRAWWEQLFSAIDSGDAVGFVTFLTPDAQFRFGNNDLYPPQWLGRRFPIRQPVHIARRHNFVLS
jgi:hypothetical protein